MEKQRQEPRFFLWVLGWTTDQLSPPDPFLLIFTTPQKRLRKNSLKRAALFFLKLCPIFYLVYYNLKHKTIPKRPSQRSSKLKMLLLIFQNFNARKPVIKSSRAVLTKKYGLSIQ